MHLDTFIWGVTHRVIDVMDVVVGVDGHSLITSYLKRCSPRRSSSDVMGVLSDFHDVRDACLADGLCDFPTAWT